MGVNDLYEKWLNESIENLKSVRVELDSENEAVCLFNEMGSGLELDNTYDIRDWMKVEKSIRFILRHIEKEKKDD